MQHTGTEFQRAGAAMRKNMERLYIAPVAQDLRLSVVRRPAPSPG